METAKNPGSASDWSASVPLATVATETVALQSL